MDNEPEEEVVENANVFRLVQNGTHVGILIDCQTEEAAKIAYQQILNSCKMNGGVNITVQGQPAPGDFIVMERGVHYSDDRN